MVSKMRYTEEFEAIVKGCVEKNVNLLQPLLYGVNTILERGYHEHIGLLMPLKKALEKGYLILDSQPNQEELWPAKSTLDRLEHVCEFFLQRIKKRSNSEQSAYMSLHKLLGKGLTQHAPQIKSMDLLKSSSVRKTLNQLVSQSSADSSNPQEAFDSVATWLRNCKEYWNVCLEFLEHNLIPHLQLIQKTINLHTVPTAVTPKQNDDTWRLINLISRYDESGYPSNEITDSVDALSGCRSIADFTKPTISEAWRVFNDEIDWYEMMFFKPNSGSDLARRIANIPASLKKGFVKGCSEAEQIVGKSPCVWSAFIELNLSEMEVEVYCPTYVLDSLFTEAFRNMSTYISSGDREVQYTVDVCNTDENFVSVTITNNNTAKFEPSQAKQGHILKNLKEDILKFGGTLEFGEPLTGCQLPEPTYYIKFVLIKWKGHVT